MRKDKRSPLERNPLFGSLPLELAENIRSMNPWWADKPGTPIPKFRRRPFSRLKHLLLQGMTPIVVLRGPRRVGKTVLLRQIIEDLLIDGVEPQRLFYFPFDELPTLEEFKEPVLALGRWCEKEILKATFNESARRQQPAYMLLDEVQNLDNWGPQIKNLVDNQAVRVLVTGSSSFRIEAGKDSLAGRITSLDLGPLSLGEIAELKYGQSLAPLWGEDDREELSTMDFWREASERGRRDAELRHKSFATFSARGAYPIAHEKSDMSWPELTQYLNETVVRRAIKHDLRVGSRGKKRDEKLLEEVFRLCCRYTGQTPGQAVFLPEIQQALDGHIGWNRILDYLKFLDGTLLIRLIRPSELRLKKKGASPNKICLCDHAIRASWLQEVIPIDPVGLGANAHLSDLAGHIAESTLGYFLASIPNLNVTHFPLRGAEPEVDFVITVGTRRIPIEVKYRKRIDAHGDTVGIRAFLEKTVYNAPFGILVTLEDDVRVLDPRILPISLSTFLWTR